MSPPNNVSTEVPMQREIDVDYERTEERVYNVTLKVPKIESTTVEVTDIRKVPFEVVVDYVETTYVEEEYTEEIKIPYIVKHQVPYHAQIQIPYEVKHAKTDVVYEVEHYTVPRRIPYVVKNPKITEGNHPMIVPTESKNKVTHSHPVLICVSILMSPFF